MNSSILVVDDEPNVRLSYRAALESEGYCLSEAQDGPSALRALAGVTFALAILDLRMPGMDGLELLSEMRQQGHLTPVVIITAHGDVPHAVRALQLGAIDFLQKPLTPAQLRHTVAEILARHHPKAAQPRPLVDLATTSEEQFSSCLTEAKRLLNLCDFVAAREVLAEAMTLNPLSAEAFSLAGVLFESLGDHSRARTYYSHALKLDHSFQPTQQNHLNITTTHPTK